MPHNKAKLAEVAGRRAQLVRLRRACVPFDDQRILDLGYTSSAAARKDLIRALEQNRDEEATEVSIYRQEAKERYLALLEAVWPAATSGEDLKANEQARKLVVDLVRLDGADAPGRTELSGPDGGAVPLGNGSLAELDKLIHIAGQTDPVVTDTEEEGTGDDSNG